MSRAKASRITDVVAAPQPSCGDWLDIGIVTMTALVLVCSLPMNAQITASLNTRPDGVTEVRVRNDSAAGLEAFALSVNYATEGYLDHSPLVLWIDPALRSFPTINRFKKQMTIAEPLMPGGEFVWPPALLPTIRTTGYVRLEQLVVAGIFSDGTTAGNPALLTRLLDRRNNYVVGGGAGAGDAPGC